MSERPGQDALDAAMRKARDAVAVELPVLVEGALKRIKAGGKRPPIADVQLIRDLMGTSGDGPDDAEVAKAQRALEALESAQQETVHGTAAKSVRFLNWYAKHHPQQWFKLAPLLGVSQRARKAKDGSD